jgi:predicted nucleic acid-binding protein
MSYLVDSNVLLRLVHRRDAMHVDAQSAFTILCEQDQALCIVPQNLIEFWAVATRPVSANGLGLTVEEAAHESSLLKGLFTLKPDTPEIYATWEQLVIKYQVKGKQAHDTRLVAAMIVHQITHLLTFNTDDFKRFSEITAIAPRNIASASSVTEIEEP